MVDDMKTVKVKKFTIDFIASDGRLEQYGEMRLKKGLSWDVPSETKEAKKYLRKKLKSWFDEAKNRKEKCYIKFGHSNGSIGLLF